MDEENVYTQFRWSLMTIQDNLEMLGTYAKDLALGYLAEEAEFPEHAREQLEQVRADVDALIARIPGRGPNI